MFKKILISSIFVFQFALVEAQNGYRDSIEVLNYSIYLDLSKTESKQITAHTFLRLKPLYKTSTIKLDLEGLTTDSVLYSGKKIQFSHLQAVLSIDFEQYFLADDTVEISVYYHGSPIRDKDWGGFFINSGYAFNYGVGMDANPPNYGRVWYPCIDNFTDRAYYEYFIKTKSNHLAACPGLLQSEKQQTDGTKIFHWKLNQSIPTYLSSVAVADYALIKDTVQGIEKIIPIEIFVDRDKEKEARTTFMNVKKFLHAFEKNYGPYKWDKIGYASTQFMYGAMEHATNIAYSSYCNGTSACESTLAHELSHHWFGDLVTCRSEKDMWLNEGWASFSEAIYYEYVGGEIAYKNQIRENHKQVLLSEINDAHAFKSIYGMPHSETYGKIVYDKGCDVAHTLRGQLGDSIFFNSLKQYFSDYAFKDISVDEFKSYLSKISKIDLNDFFNFWVYGSGFPHFIIDYYSVVYQKNNYQLDFSIKQQLLNSADFLNSSDIEIGILDNNLKLTNYKIKHNGKNQMHSLKLDYEPMLVLIDPDEKIADATTDEYLWIKTPDNYSFKQEYFNLNILKLPAPVFFQITYHWVSPISVPSQNEKFKIFNKYWEIKYFGKKPMVASAKFSFDMDATLFMKTATTILEKIRLIYRENNMAEWQIIDSPLEIKNQQVIFSIQPLMPWEYSISAIQ